MKMETLMKMGREMVMEMETLPWPIWSARTRTFLIPDFFSKTKKCQPFVRKWRALPKRLNWKHKIEENVKSRPKTINVQKENKKTVVVRQIVKNYVYTEKKDGLKLGKII